jgi:hypothetical protein
MHIRNFSEKFSRRNKKKIRDSSRVSSTLPSYNGGIVLLGGYYA